MELNFILCNVASALIENWTQIEEWMLYFKAFGHWFNVTIEKNALSSKNGLEWDSTYSQYCLNLVEYAVKQVSKSINNHLPPPPSKKT